MYGLWEEQVFECPRIKSVCFFVVVSYFKSKNFFLSIYISHSYVALHVYR